MKWSDEFPRINYENEKMFCTLCVKFPDLSSGMACSFVAGSTSFHKPTLKSHDQSIKHLACVKYTRLQDKSSSVAQTVSKIQEKVGDLFIFKHQNPFRYAQNAGFCIKYFKIFKEVCTQIP